MKVAVLRKARQTFRGATAQILRLIVKPVVRSIYRLKVVNPEQIPAQGGVMILPNHVSFIDALLIGTACARPVRFVMDGHFTKHAGIRIFTALFETVNIRRDSPLDAIREVLRALSEGHLICLFPEGQLTRTGTLCTLQKGYELIARKAGVPLIPVWDDGAWGTIASYERNRFFGKIPRGFGRGVTIAFGGALGKTDPATLRDALHETSALALGSRFNSTVWALRKPAGDSPAAEIFRQQDAKIRRRLWRNAHQIGMVNAIHRASEIHALREDPIVACFPGLCAGFPSLFRGKLTLHECFDGDHAGAWIGGEMLREQIHTTQINREIEFYDFGENATDPLDRGNVCHLACFGAEGVVISMSMRTPPPPGDGMPAQVGHLARSLGRLLPGWFLRADETGNLRAHGPAGPAAGISLPPGCTLSGETFLMAREKPARRIF